MDADDFDRADASKSSNEDGLDNDDSTEPARKESASAETGKKKSVSMQLSSQTLQKLLKEGKMARLPSGSFRISADALKELKQDKNFKGENPKKRKRSETDDEAPEEQQNKMPKPAEKEPEPEPQAEPETETDAENDTEAETENDGQPEAIPAESSRDAPSAEVQNNEEVVEDNPEEPSSSTALENVSVINRKTARRDYISDFNSSEDEDEEFMSTMKESLAELIPRKYSHKSEGVSLLLEKIDKAMFGNISDDENDDIDEDDTIEEDHIRRLAEADPDFGDPKSYGKIHDIPKNFYMVGRIGNGCKTKMCIRSTQKTKTFEGRQYPVYNIDTGVEQTNTVTPLMVTALTSESRKPDGPEDPAMAERYLKQGVSLRKYKEQLKVLRRRYLTLAHKSATQPGLSTIADLTAASARFLTQDQLLLYGMQLKGGCDATQGARFCLREKMLGLSLWQQSPESYQWLRSLLHLPSPPTLERWLDAVAREDPARCKALMFHVYTRYVFRPRDDMVPQILAERAQETQ